jgi:hypothetical protein
VEEAELLLHDVRLGVVGDALAEHGGHQLVGLALADLVVAHAEVFFLGGVTGHGDADGAGEAEAEDVAEHGPAAGDHVDRAGAHLDRVADHGQAAGEHGREAGGVELERLQGGPHGRRGLLHGVGHGEHRRARYPRTARGGPPRGTLFS